MKQISVKPWEDNMRLVCGSICAYKGNTSHLTRHHHTLRFRLYTGAHGGLKDNYDLFWIENMASSGELHELFGCGNTIAL